MQQFLRWSCTINSAAQHGAKSGLSSKATIQTRVFIPEREHLSARCSLLMWVQCAFFFRPTNSINPFRISSLLHKTFLKGVAFRKEARQLSAGQIRSVSPQESSPQICSFLFHCTCLASKTGKQSILCICPKWGKQSNKISENENIFPILHYKTICWHLK